MKSMKRKLSIAMMVILLFSEMSCKKDKDEDNNNNGNNTPTVPVGTIVSSISLNYACAVAIYDHYAYVGQKTQGFSVVDISNPASPTVVKTVSISDVRKLFVHNGKLYVAAYVGGAAVYSLSNPANPTFERSIMQGDQVSNIFADDQYIYLAGGVNSTNGFISIHNQSDGSLVGQYINNNASESNRGYASLWVSGNYIYAGTNGGYFHVIDKTNPQSPTKIGSYFNTGTPGHEPWMLGMYVSGNKAYLADWGAGLIVLDISNPSSPAELGVFTGGSDGPNAYDVVVDGNTAYVANGWGCLTVVNVQNPASMSMIFEVNPSSSSYQSVKLYGNYAVVADNGQQKMSIIRVK